MTKSVFFKCLLVAFTIEIFLFSNTGIQTISSSLVIDTWEGDAVKLSDGDIYKYNSQTDSYINRRGQYSQTLNELARIKKETESVWGEDSDFSGYVLRPAEYGRMCVLGEMPEDYNYYAFLLALGAMTVFFSALIAVAHHDLCG